MQAQRHEGPHRQSLINIRAVLTTFRDVGLEKTPKNLDAALPSLAWLVMLHASVLMLEKQDAGPARLSPPEADEGQWGGFSDGFRTPVAAV